MILVIGGAYQGKLAFAKQLCREADILYRTQDIIKRALSEGKDASSYINEIIDANPDIIVICDEVGGGVVPMDSLLNEYREAVGRVMLDIAERADEVYRVYCGIGERIK